MIVYRATDLLKSRRADGTGPFKDGTGPRCTIILNKKYPKAKEGTVITYKGKTFVKRNNKWIPEN